MKKHGSFPYLVFVSFLLLPVVFAIHASASSTQPPAPVLFFADLILGANTGNSDTTYSSSGGVYVTLYGNYLDNYTSITLGGSSCLKVVSAPAAYLWYERMVVMIGTGCSTGNFAIATPGGTFSGPMLSTKSEQRSNDFTVVSGHIYYVATGGSGSGTFSSPWGSVHTAESTMGDGDVTYVMNGYSDSSLDPTDGDGVLDPSPAECASSSSTQRAMAAYPGATVTLGSTSQGYAAWSTDSNAGSCGGYELAEMDLRSSQGAISVIAGGGACPAHCVYNMRFVADDLSCPGGNSESGCEQDGGGGGGAGDPSIVSGIITYGIYIHDTGAGGTTLYHAMYHGTTADIIDGWGYINPTLGGATGVWNGIQLYTSTGSFVGYDVHIHDMMITNTSGHGILWGLNGDPATSGTYGGGEELYNDVIWNTGTSGSDNDCVQFAAPQPSGSVTSNFYNNTLYSCGASTSGEGLDTGYYASGCTSSTCILNMNNNIIDMTSGVYIQNGGSVAGQIIGANNDLYGVGAISSSTVQGGWSATGSLNSNPNFTSTSTPNFVPLSGSPVIGAGTTTAPVAAYDVTGLLRPSPPSIGAYEYAAASDPPPPTPPTGLTAAVQSGN